MPGKKGDPDRSTFFRRQLETSTNDNWDERLGQLIHTGTLSQEYMTPWILLGQVHGCKLNVIFKATDFLCFRASVESRE